MTERTVALEVRDLKKSFLEKQVLKGVSFKVYDGEILGLFGGSGSGKSVILRSIIGLEKSDSGSIWFEGSDITLLPEHQLIPIRIKIGYVFQNGALFDSLTVEENLAYPLLEHTSLSLTEIKEKIIETLRKVGMEGTQHLLPAELSGGMQKRAGLARATILNPRITLFDEPTAGLDPINTKRLLENLNRLKADGITGIFVTHDIPSAFEIADRIAILFDGRIQVIDSVENIRNSKDPLVQSFISEFITNNGHASQPRA